VAVTATATLKAIAAKTGWSNSSVASAGYTITGTVATPTFSPVAGTYTSAQAVTISSSTSGATIYYTTDGSAPTTSSTLYTAPATVSSTATLRAYAILANWNDSAVGSAVYTITGTVATPTFSVAAGTYTSAQLVVLSTTTPGATIYYTTDGSTPTTSSTQYSSALNVTATETLKAIAVKTSWANSSTASASYTITGTVATPTFSVAAGTYTTAQSVTIATTTAGTTIYYTIDGSTPTTASSVYSGPVSVGVTETLQA
jgi:hypothetical protein